MFNSFLFKKDLKTLSTWFLTLISLTAFAGGDSTPSHPHPPSLPPSPLNQDPCEDLSFLAELNWPNTETSEWPFNPLKKGEEYDVRENSEGFDYIYHAWYQGRADGKYPIYYWKRTQKPTTQVQSYQRAIPLVDICTGCVVGFGCEQINIFQNGCESRIQLVWKWADFRDVCQMLKKTPELKTAFIRELKKRNLYGALELKNSNTNQFLKRFEFYSHQSLAWENWKSNYEKNSSAPAKTPEQQPKVNSVPSLPSSSVSEIKPTPIPDDVIKLKPAPDKSKLPIAKKADGKPGYVVSPYVPGKLIDAIDVPSGTEVGDPYALGKTFLVP
jgi:hypothetical protein